MENDSYMYCTQCGNCHPSDDFPDQSKYGHVICIDCTKEVTTIEKSSAPKQTIDMVREFHEIYSAPIQPSPCIPLIERSALRYELMHEELNEFADACATANIVEILDALIDLQYVLDGTFLEFGLQNIKQKAFEEVHRSNLSKLGRDGKPIKRGDGKVLKGPDFFNPDLETILLREIQKGKSK